MLLLRSNLLLVLQKLRVRFPERRRRRRRGLVESGRNFDLLLIHLLHSLHLVVLRDSLEVLRRPVQQGHTDVGGLERTNIVGSVSSHERGVTEILERVQDEFLLRRRDPGVDPSVRDKVVDGRLGLVLLERGSGDTDVVSVEQGLVESLVRVHRDDLRLVHVLPNQLIGSRALLQVEDHDLSVDDLDVSSDVHGGKRVVSGDHDTLPVSLTAFNRKKGGIAHSVRRISEHLEHLNRVGLERAVEHQESSKVKLALDLVSRDVVDLVSDVDSGEAVLYSPGPAGCSSS
jgi:hypothetical protein